MKKQGILVWAFLGLMMSSSAALSADILPIPAPAPVPAAPAIDPAVVAQIKSYFENGSFSFLTSIDQTTLSDLAKVEYDQLQASEACAKNHYCPEVYEDTIGTMSFAVIYEATPDSYSFSIYTVDGKILIAKGQAIGSQPFAWLN
jgi:hypothetical protein